MVAQVRGAKFIRQDERDGPTDALIPDENSKASYDIAQKALEDVAQWLGFEDYHEYNSASMAGGLALVRFAAKKRRR